MASERKRCWLSIDPGLRGTGVAVWFNDRLVEAFTITRKNKEKKEPWLERAFHIVREFYGKVFKHRPEEVYIEEPFVDTHSAQTLAAASSESVTKLTIVTGMLITTSLDVMEYSADPDEEFEVHLVAPRKWKGQLTDEMLKGRIDSWADKTKQDLPEALSEHAIDAIGLGLHVLELL